MQANDIVVLVRKELDAYRPALTTQETLGERFSVDRELAEIAKLKESLLLPSQRRMKGSSSQEREVWLVATADEYVVFLDASRREYGLGVLEPDGTVRDVEVYGDLVGTFMAR